MIKEVVANTVEKNSEALRISKSFDPDKRLDVRRDSREDKSVESKYDPDRRVEPTLDYDKEYTTAKERIWKAKQSNGEWLGEVGDSRFIPSSEVAQKELKSFDQKGIDYKAGNPDFSKCSVDTIQLEKMTSDRLQDHRRADAVLAKQWSAEGKFGKSDWTRTDIREWRHDNRYSWHERIDKRTMDLVQRDIHDECKHFGGIAECKRMEKAGGVFDV